MMKRSRRACPPGIARAKSKSCAPARDLNITVVLLRAAGNNMSPVYFRKCARRTARPSGLILPGTGYSSLDGQERHLPFFDADAGRLRCHMARATRSGANLCPEDGL
jgi:hypothetical protein